eukprot:6586460-Prymnesium_polylepis.1
MVKHLISPSGTRDAPTICCEIAKNAVNAYFTSVQLNLSSRPHFSPPAPNQANSPDSESSR